MGQKYTQLNLKEREEIYRYKKDGKAKIWIAKKLEKSYSTIRRELKRNTIDDNLGYLPDRANKAARERRLSKGLKIESNPELKRYIIEKLRAGWSPEAIAGRTKKESSISFQVSHETIYNFVYSEEGKKLGLYYLLMRKKPRRGKIYGRKQRKSIIPNRTSIHDRPKEIDKRIDVGHLEGDLTFSKGDKSANLGVVVERKTRFAFLIKNDSKHANTTMRNIFNKLAPLPKNLIQSVTFDNGGEFARHDLLRKFMNIDTYFCDPGSPWQKGQVERTNSMLHRYISKKTPIKSLSEQAVENAQNMLNNLPRKCLGWRTPAEAFNEEICALQN